MKKIILSALVISMALAVNAQKIPERKSGEHGTHHKMDRKKGQRMDMQKLNLTDDQKAKFKTQRESFQKQMEDLKKNDNITVKEWNTRKATIQKENKTKMQSFLSADQKAQIEKNKAEMKQKFEARANDRGEKMKEKLELTADQSAKLDKNRAEMQQKMKAIKENSKLSDEQKKTQMMELRKSQKESMKSILTEDQLKKMKDSQHRKSGNRDGNRKRPARNETI